MKRLLKEKLRKISNYKSKAGNQSRLFSRMPKMPSYIYVLEDMVLLKTHHVKSSVITRIRRGYASVYDITEEDLLGTTKNYLKIAEVEQLPVILEVNNVTRLLIFDKKYATH